MSADTWLHDGAGWLSTTTGQYLPPPAAGFGTASFGTTPFGG